MDDLNSSIRTCPDIPSQQVDLATAILPIDKEINTSDESFDLNGGGASGSETFVESEAPGTELCAVIFDATEELDSQGIAEAGATKQDAKAVGRGTPVSNDGGLISDWVLKVNLEAKTKEARTVKRTAITRSCLMVWNQQNPSRFPQ